MNHAGRLPSWGRLTSQQARLVRKVVAGRHVHDLGAGSGALAMQLLALGAEHVTAVEIGASLGDMGLDALGVSQLPVDPHAKLSWHRGSWSTLTEPIDVAFVSWPWQASTDLLTPVCAAAKRVIYLGKNTDMTACGSTDFFRMLLGRRLLWSRADRRNSLVIAGEPIDRPRSPTQDEYAALYFRRSVISYADSCRHVYEIQRGRRALPELVLEHVRRTVHVPLKTAVDG